MNILFLSRWYPCPPDNGSKLRINTLLRGLRQHHDLTLLSFVEPSEQAAITPAPPSICTETHIVAHKPFQPRSLRARLAYLGLRPRSVITTFSHDFVRELRRLLEARQYDLVIASQFDTAIYASHFQGIPALFEEVELSVLYERFARADSIRKRLRHGLTWLKHRRYLTRLLPRFRACTVASCHEKDLLGRALPSVPRIDVIPNAIDLHHYAGVAAPKQPKTLLFLGSLAFAPNYEAMAWFIRYVLPKVASQEPDVQLVITGDPKGRQLPDASNVTLTGYLEDIRPAIASAAVSIVPILTGGGTRLKILEAMALHTPVVATTKGAEGLEAHSGEHLLIADTPDAFAEAVLRLLRSPKLQQRIASNAYRLVQQRYDAAVILPPFLELVDQVAAA